MSKVGIGVYVTLPTLLSLNSTVASLVTGRILVRAISKLARHLKKLMATIKI